MTSVEDMCNSVRKWKERADIEGLEDVMSGVDAIKFDEYLIRASELIGIMDGWAWTEGDYAYLVERLRVLYGTLWSIAVTSGPGDSLYDRVLDASESPPQQ